MGIYEEETYVSFTATAVGDVGDVGTAEVVVVAGARGRS